MSSFCMLRKCSSGVKITRLLMSSGRYDLPRNGSVTRDGVAVAFCKMREIQHTGCKCLLSHHSLEYQRKNDAPSSTRPLFHPKVRNFGRVAMEIVNRSPPVIQPYLKLLRIDRPIGTWLLFWPGAWSIGLAAEAGCFPDVRLLFLFGVGALVMRGAGCVVNDMWDKNIDTKVARTRDRPIASGQISRLDAFVFLSGMLAIGDIVLLNLNWESIVLGASSLGLIACYPLMKRFSNWPQLGLGLVFNWGAMLGWIAVKGALDLPVCMSLYLSCVCWTLIYDTVYALQDKKDDLSVGVKSTAVTLGPAVKKYLIGFSGMMAAGLTTTGIICNQTFPYYIAVSIALAQTIHQTVKLNINDPGDCGKTFISHAYLGWIIMTGIVLGTLLKEVNV